MLVHAATLAFTLFPGPGLSLGFFNAASLIAWLVIAMTLLSSFRVPVTSLLIGLFPLGLITVLTALLPNEGGIRVSGEGG